MAINIHEFKKQYDNNYDWLYNGGDELSDYPQLVQDGDALISYLRENRPDFLDEWIEYRQDLMVSDREVAAFALTILDMVGDKLDNFS